MTLPRPKYFVYIPILLMFASLLQVSEQVPYFKTLPTVNILSEQKYDKAEQPACAGNLRNSTERVWVSLS